jgi:hypothetical protein
MVRLVGIVVVSVLDRLSPLPRRSRPTEHRQSINDFGYELIRQRTGGAGAITSLAAGVLSQVALRMDLL